MSITSRKNYTSQTERCSIFGKKCTCTKSSQAAVFYFISPTTFCACLPIGRRRAGNTRCRSVNQSTDRSTRHKLWQPTPTRLPPPPILSLSFWVWACVCVHPRSITHHLGHCRPVTRHPGKAKQLEVQQNTGIPVRTGVSRAYRYGSAVRYVPVHSGVFGSLCGSCWSSITRHCPTSVW